jgi:DNA-binding NarL/FixJ family response regulator
MAVECAISIQQLVLQRNARHPDYSLQVCAGLSAGQPLREAEPLFDSAMRTAREICKAAAPGTVLVSAAVRELCRGKSFAFTEHGMQALSGAPEPMPLYSVGGEPVPQTREMGRHRLSDREVEVIRLIAAGRSNQQIADELIISLNTVVRHVANIFDKAAVHNRTEAAAYAFHSGLA